MRWLKNIGKHLVVAVLGWQLRRLQARHNPKTVGVVGSYGKTSTKFGIAAVLEQQFRVRFQTGNYNDLVTVPLVFFDEPTPSLLNPFAWTAVFMRNERQIRGPYPYDVVVLELGTDGPGQIAAFGRYLNLDFLVVTAIAHEHMESFANLQAVADEELAAQTYSKQVIYNADLCAARYMAALTKPALSFGNGDVDYKLDKVTFTRGAHAFHILYKGKPLLEASYEGVAKMQLYSACAATSIGHQLGMSTKKIAKGIAAITPVSGRMQTLEGIHGSTILDETYNASPSATTAALDVLYGMSAPQKIALLGNMNELGKYSQAAHTKVGKYCDPKQLDLVITLGPDANQYLAPAAQAKGCKVKQCASPYEAGEYLRGHLKENALILAKGSQNKVFAEEAIKMILANPADAQKLVRQSPAWLKKKAANFKT